MKPIKLTMYGFMTYKDKIEIDFRKLYDSRIFVIAGDTGSGKTSIFDAISFALFGGISRPDVDQIDLRSDFLSEEDPPTYVNFIFDMDEKTYEIERKPLQYAKKKVKPGVKISHEVEFYELENGKRKLLTDKVTETQDMVKEILGLDQSQLKKVMLLAQGEFSEFLSADSATKAELLSDIFQTGEYGDITEKLKDMTKSYSKDLENLDEKLDQSIKRYEDLDDLVDESIRYRHDFIKIGAILGKLIKDKNDAIKVLEKKEKEEKKRQKNLLDQKNQAKTENDQIALYIKLKDEKEKLDKDLEKYQKLRQALKDAKNASSISPYYKRLEDIKKSKDDLEKTIKEKSKEEKNLEESFSKAKKEKEGLADLKKEVDRLKIDLDKLNEKKKSLESFSKIEKAYREGKKNKKDLEKLKEKIEEKRLEESELSNKLFDQNKILMEFKDKKNQIIFDQAELRRSLEKLSEEKTRVEKNESIKKKIESFKIKIQRIDKDLIQARDDYDKALANQENIEKQKFIRILNEEGTCPICGTVHEEKIEEKEIYNLDLESMREIYNKFRNEKSKLENEVSIYKENLSSDLPSLNDLLKECEELKLKEKSLEIALKENEKILSKIEKTNKDLEKEKTDLAKRKDKLEAQKTQISEKMSDFESIERSFLAHEESLKDLSLKDLEDQIKETSKNLGESTRYIEKTEENFRRLDKDLGQVRSFLQGAKENLKSLEKTFKESKEDFKKRLKDYFVYFDEFIYKLNTYEDLKKKEDEIEDFFRSYQESTIRLDSLKLYEDKSPVDLEIFDKKLRILEEDIKEISKEYTEKSIDLNALKEISKDLNEIERSYKEKAREGQVLARLSKIASGKDGAVKGYEKMDFETFVLIYYFEKILSYSNQRLYKMSNGQYRMVRKVGGDKRSRQGLDIEIIDSNTGKRRPASTLSGGETFLASLSLALGLSDEIAAENGGIKIDTLFIDEGFGSLSENYLQNAIATIEKLSYENKFIGLISHVQEVKNAIDSKILVSYDKSKGSEVELIV